MKKEKFEQIAKWGGGIAIVLGAGALAAALLASILSIAACAFTGLAAINLWPVAVTKLSNWKYRQLRQEAIENPIPTLSRQFDEAVKRFREKRQGVVKFSTTTKNFKDKIERYEANGADTTAMSSMYGNMKRALEFQVLQLSDQQQNLEEFKIKLGEAQDAYSMALDMQEANNSLESFTGESGQEFVLQREAFDAITSKLNEGFARMEISMSLDYAALPNSVQEREVMHLSDINQKLKATEFA